MINILPIQPHQLTHAKHVITAVARRIFEPEKSVQEFYGVLAERHELEDVEHYQNVYVENRGIFLAVVDEGTVVGTGALKKYAEDIGELKRLWLLEEYHGRKIGYRVVLHLLNFACAHAYRRVRLQTHQKQERAIRFYKRLGFTEIPSDQESIDDVSMELMV